MKKRGRPKGGAQIGHEVILSAAFELLNRAGHQGLSMRALAKELGVTPMALYSHFTDRDALVRGMSDTIYAQVVKKFESTQGKPHRQLEKLLSLYYEAVVQFPHLTVLIFASTTEFSKETQKINYHLSNLLAESKLKISKRKMWLEILVDFTHGSALAVASAPRSNKRFVETQKLRYRRQLAELLSHIF
ncbi:TetR/AcrR family transcriptional regulator [Bdellovibrio sp. HCB-110]|uniref:TetR/AcrR family transcriptional regulator n=1 Tax=Bdellovibrio sp. HCB-110 TaxID=3391182 RepID=UPI0039B48014